MTMHEIEIRPTLIRFEVRLNGRHIAKFWTMNSAKYAAFNLGKAIAEAAQRDLPAEGMRT